jgi:hypothetical protein
MTYTIARNTLLAVAKLRELHVLREQAADIKEYGAPQVPAEFANVAVLQFNNGSVTQQVLPVKVLAKWVACLPADAKLHVETSDSTLRLSEPAWAIADSAIRSQVKLLTVSPPWKDSGPAAISLDADKDGEFKLSYAASDDELTKLKAEVATVRKSAKQSKELRIAHENEREAFHELRHLTENARSWRATVAAKPLANAVAEARVEQVVRREIRRLNRSIEDYWHREPVLPFTDGLADDIADHINDLHGDRYEAEKKGYNRKADKFLIELGNLWADSWQEVIAAKAAGIEAFAHHANIKTLHDIRRSSGLSSYSNPPSVGCYGFPNDDYSRARRNLRQYTADRVQRVTDYKLALARLRKAENNS